MLGMSKETMIKMAANLAKGYFDKNPTAEIKISAEEANTFLEKNSPGIKVEIQEVEGVTHVVIKKC